MRDQFSEVHRFLDAATVDGQGTAVRCKHWRHLELVLKAAGVAEGETFTIKVKGCILKDGVEPTWSSAASATNPWYYIQIVDKDTGTAYDGATGYVVTTSEVKPFEINTFGEDMINVEISGSSGTYTATVDGRFFMGV